jgi:hypothetical protein
MVDKENYKAAAIFIHVIYTCHFITDMPTAHFKSDY